MSNALLRRDGWLLAATADTDFDEIMGWFGSAESVNIWGGPVFRYPFTNRSFREDCHLDEMAAYSLRDPQGRLAAFGQSYERDGRGHLARLVSNPAMRRRGVGKRLIEMIIAVLAERHDFAEYSLFVFRDNEAAYRCYRSLGFAVQDYPDGAPLPDQCYFLTRKRRQ